jgi:hypothetical protein
VLAAESVVDVRDDWESYEATEVIRCIEHTEKCAAGGIEI